MVLNLGLVGLGLALTTLALSGRRAVRIARSPEAGAFAFAPLLIVAFIVEMNGIEAALINANDIFVLIYMTAAVASGEMLATLRRGCGPAVDDPGDGDDGQIDGQHLQP